MFFIWKLCSTNTVSCSSNSLHAHTQLSRMGRLARQALLTSCEPSTQPQPSVCVGVEIVSLVRSEGRGGGAGEEGGEGAGQEGGEGAGQEDTDTGVLRNFKRFRKVSVVYIQSMHTYIVIHTHTYIHTHTHTYIHTYTHTYTYVHAVYMCNVNCEYYFSETVIYIMPFEYNTISNSPLAIYYMSH